MTTFDFKTEADRLILAVSVLSQIDLAQIVSTVDRADSLGPILMPSEFQRSSGDMHEVAQLARLAQSLVARLEALRERAEVPS